MGGEAMSRLTLSQAAQAAESSPTTMDRRRYLKALLVGVWGQLPHDDRQTFMDRVEVGTLKFLPLAKSACGSEIENVLRQLRSMLDHFHGRDSEFLKSIQRQSRKQDWKPSDAQRDWLMRLFREWKADIAALTGEGEDLVLIEDDQSESVET